VSRSQLKPVPPGTEFGRWSVMSEIPFAGQGRLVRVRCSGCGDERTAFLNIVKANRTSCACTATPRPLGKSCACGCGEELVGVPGRHKQYADISHRNLAQYRRDLAKVEST
jgi:ribosomal protein S27E